jgi:Bifunctional DNA primase/polymerase, N-terminal
VKGYVGHHRRSPDEIREDINRIAPDSALGISLPLGTIGIDVDTHGDKTGGATLCALIHELGALPPTVVSTRRGRPSRASDEFSGILLYQLPAWAVHRDGEALVKMLSVVGPGIETIQFHERHVAVAPTVLDGESYRWWHPDGTDSALPPAVTDLPVLPDTWVRHLYKTGFTLPTGHTAPRHSVGDLIDGWHADQHAWDTQRSRLRRATPNLGAGGAAPRDAPDTDTLYADLDADEALTWIRAALPGWTQEPNRFLWERLHEFEARFQTGVSRHDATRDFIWGVLRMCAGDERENRRGNPGGEKICVRAMAALIQARDRDAHGHDSVVRAECERFVVHGVAKLRAEMESGALMAATSLYGSIETGSRVSDPFLLTDAYYALNDDITRFDSLYETFSFGYSL